MLRRALGAADVAVTCDAAEILLTNLIKIPGRRHRAKIHRQLNRAVWGSQAEAGLDRIPEELRVIVEDLLMFNSDDSDAQALAENFSARPEDLLRRLQTFCRSVGRNEDSGKT